jgi:hypothetical protein
MDLISRLTELSANIPVVEFAKKDEKESHVGRNIAIGSGAVVAGAAGVGTLENTLYYRRSHRDNAYNRALNAAGSSAARDRIKNPETRPQKVVDAMKKAQRQGTRKGLMASVKRPVHTTVAGAARAAETAMLPIALPVALQGLGQPYKQGPIQRGIETGVFGTMDALESVRRWGHAPDVRQVIAKRGAGRRIFGR